MHVFVISSLCFSFGSFCSKSLGSLVRDRPSGHWLSGYCLILNAMHVYMSLTLGALHEALFSGFWGRMVYDNRLKR